MKKLTLIIFLFLFAFNSYANDIEYTLKKNQKIIGTYSGDINQESSLHSIILKNRKLNNFEIVTFYIDKKGNSNKLALLTFRKEPSILSHHFSNDKLTLLVNQTFNDKIFVIINDLDIKTGKNVKKALGEYHLKNIVFKNHNKTILLNYKDKILSLIEIRNSQEVIRTEVKIVGYDYLQIKELFKFRPIVINTNEYVNNGSIASSKAYIYKNDIYIESTKKTAHSSILTFNINNIAAFKTTRIYVKSIPKILNSNSFIFDQKLITTSVSKDDSQISISDIGNNKIIAKWSLKKDLSKLISEKTIASFIKQSRKKVFKPTITANRTVENNVLINIDYVNPKTYYYNDWMWWHHQQFQHFQQQQQMMNRVKTNIPPRFGPNTNNYIPSSSFVIKKNKIQFVINSEYKIIPNASKETLKRNIDKNKFINDIKNNQTLKHVSISFLKDIYRVAYYSKNLKKVIIKKGTFK